MTPISLELVRIVSEQIVNLAHVMFLAYAIRILSTQVFAYLNHRLDVLGKDALVFYPRDRYSETPPEESSLSSPLTLASTAKKMGELDRKFSKKTEYAAGRNVE